MDITVKLEHIDGYKNDVYWSGITVSHNGEEYIVELDRDESKEIEFEVNTNNIDLRDIDEDVIKNHLESIYGSLFREGEEFYMKEHLEDEGYYIADCIDDAEEEIEEYINEQTNKWVVDPDEIDEVDTFEFVSEALNKKGYYILKIPSFLQAWIGGSK